MMAPAHADVHKWEHLPFPKSLPQFQKLFPDNERCALYSGEWKHPSVSGHG